MRLYLVKDDPQGQGSAVTYARRYSYMSVLGLVADVDDDGNAASREQVQKSISNMKQQVARSAAPPTNSAPAPATPTGEKAKASPTMIAYLQYADALNRQSENPNSALSDIAVKASKYPLTAKQLGFATKLADDVLKANRKDPDEEMKRIAHETSQVQMVAEAFNVNEEPF
jgi:hypothetical protein